MKLKDQYNLLKKEYLDYIILLKSGSFYVTFGDDAIILNYLFGYQKVNNKVGFPIKNIDKITKTLQDLSIHYVIDNGFEFDRIEEKASTNCYMIQFENAKKLEFKANINHMLLERIEFLINSNSENYDKIKRFVDEL